jgi:hypothetical protein
MVPLFAAPVIGLFCLGLPLKIFANEKTVLNVLTPLQTLQAGLVTAFEKASGAAVRTGFLGLSADTDNKVRQDSTVWDVVISDELQLRRLVRLDRLSRLDADRAADSIGMELRDVGGKPQIFYAPLFLDPVGLSCKLPAAQRVSSGSATVPSGSVALPSGAPTLRWTDLSLSLIEAGMLGEVVLGLPVLVQAALADSIIGHSSGRTQATGSSASSHASGASSPADGGQSDDRIVFPDVSSRQDDRVVWLRKLHWQTRPPRASIDAEILSDRVSCVVTYLSVHRGLSQYFSSDPERSSSGLVFIIPDGKTIVRRIAAAVAEETSKQVLARQFVDHLVARKFETAKRNGLCADVRVYPEKEKPDPYCVFEAVDVLAELPSVPERMLRLLETGYLRKHDTKEVN